MNIYDWMTANVDRDPTKPAFIADGNGASRAFTWAEFADLVDRMRTGLRERGVKPGERVAISMPNGPELVASLLATVGEAGVAVVLPVPNGRRDGAYVDRALGVWTDCEPVLLIEADSLRERRKAFEALAKLPAVTASSLALFEPNSDPRRAGADGDQPVFLQYTSGSTKRPRGVVVTSEMVDANCGQVEGAYGDNPSDIAVSWVPLYHDMGLVTAVMRPLYFGYTSVLQQPTDFVVNPLSWLRAISDYGATLSSAPDFAYAHCARRLRPEDLDGLDLRRWRIARNAGEVVRPETMDAFLTLTREAGFSERAFCPSYGMAEATLTVTTSTPDNPPRRIQVDVSRLRSGDTVVLDSLGHTLLSSGPALDGTTVRAGASGIPEGTVGELQILGAQVASSYFHSVMPRAEDGALRTGDLGFVLDGHLFVLGRHDDVLIVNGVNYFQHDVAAACAAVPGVRPGRIAAFIDDLDPSRKDVVLVAEVQPGADATLLPAAIRSRVFDAVGLIVAHIELAASGSIPVTTSGKVRVSSVREEYLERRAATPTPERELL